MIDTLDEEDSIFDETSAGTVISLNQLYGYSRNNPLRYFDSLGLSPEGERGASGGSSGSGTGNKYKHCKEHPTDPTKIICKHHQTGKKVVKPKPADWPTGTNTDNNSNRSTCDGSCKKVVKATRDIFGAIIFIIVTVCTGGAATS